MYRKYTHIIEKKVLKRDDDDENSSAVELSRSEKRRRQIRKKYGICLKDEDVRIVPTVLLHKHHNTSDLNLNKSSKYDRSMKDGSMMSSRMDPDQSSCMDSQFDQTSKRMDSKDIQQEKIDQLLKEITKLLLRIAELEKLEQKAAVTISKLRSDLDAKEKTITKLNNKITQLERKELERQEKSVERIVEEEEKMEMQRLFQNPEQEAVAMRGLAILKRNQILEQVLKPSEANLLAQFFLENMSKPNKTIVQLIDRAFDYGIEVLLMRPDLFEDVVDNELRIFLLDGTKAKRVLLDCMLFHPEYVPISWGGDMLVKRQKNRQNLAKKDLKSATEFYKIEKKVMTPQGNTLTRSPKTPLTINDSAKTIPSLAKFSPSKPAPSPVKVVANSVRAISSPNIKEAIKINAQQVTSPSVQSKCSTQQVTAPGVSSKIEDRKPTIPLTKTTQPAQESNISSKVIQQKSTTMGNAAQDNLLRQKSVYLNVM
ncbi:hypothetical protein DICVIV_06276 [Dictyocaulus viviparus]|uniref:DUF7774 domain-containing protein n=1 Tax=Dictyocaulus viviparus TaxID=29172 RepID=A0A0D8XUV4_DICVI|nr:hypothetical protein DICVIV_06276 [Dictyocaulus viviparus]